MRCPNCGSNLQEKIVCPKCGNRISIEKVEQDNKEYDLILRAFQKRARKITTGFLTIAVVAAVLFVLTLVGASIYSRIAPEKEYRQLQENLDRLETCYQAKDYSQMNDVLHSIDGAYAAIYDKYSIIGSMYDKVTGAESAVPDDIEYLKKDSSNPTVLKYSIRDLFEVLDGCKKLQANGFVYGEEAQVRDFAQRAETLLKDVLLFTDEEIQIGQQKLKGDYYDYEPYCEIVVQRLQKGERQ